MEQKKVAKKGVDKQSQSGKRYIKTASRKSVQFVSPGDSAMNETAANDTVAI